MSDLVSADEIEKIVGVKRHPTEHIARAVTATETVYILHSQQCKDSRDDLRTCPYSWALDRGIADLGSWWYEREDRPVVVIIIRGRLYPMINISAGSEV